MSKDLLSDEFYEARRKELKERVKPKRYEHSLGVSKTAQHLAKVYGQDEKKARLAGILHDWDKNMRNNEIRAHARDLGLEDEIGAWVIENMPEVLHGVTAAESLKLAYPDLPDDVIHAIKVHTIGSLEMSELDKILYIADAIEPNREFDEADRIRDMIGDVTLDDIYYEIYKHWIKALIDRQVVMHPQTIDIWNSLVFERSMEKKKKYD